MDDEADVNNDADADDLVAAANCNDNDHVLDGAIDDNDGHNDVVDDDYDAGAFFRDSDDDSFAAALNDKNNLVADAVFFQLIQGFCRCCCKVVNQFISVNAFTLRWHFRLKVFYNLLCTGNFNLGAKNNFIFADVLGFDSRPTDIHIHAIIIVHYGNYSTAEMYHFIHH